MFQLWLYKFHYLCGIAYGKHVIKKSDFMLLFSSELIYGAAGRMSTGCNRGADGQVNISGSFYFEEFSVYSYMTLLITSATICWYFIDLNELVFYYCVLVMPPLRLRIQCFLEF